MVAVSVAAICARPELLDGIRGGGESVDPCQSPLAWHIRSVDPRSPFSEEDVRRAMAEAEAVWERAAGRELFRPDTVGSMAIEIIYDERQQAYDDRREREAEIDELAERAESLQAIVVRRERALERARRLQESDPSPAGARALRDAVDRLNASVRRYNRAAERYNQALAELRAESGSMVRAGELNAVSRTINGRVVAVDRVLTVAAAGGYDELVVVLAHELGHALGLDHVDDPRALMAAAYRQHDVSRPVRLRRADLRALARRCELTP